MGTVGKGTATGGGKYPCFINVLLGGGASGSIVWLRVVGHIGGNDEDSGGNPYKLPKESHREEGMEKHRRGVVNTGGRRVVEVSWN